MNNPALLNYVVNNSWCDPQQDQQFIIKAGRASNRLGVTVCFDFMGTEINLPAGGKRYHVFFAGQITAEILNLINPGPVWAIAKWRSFSESIITNNIMIDLFTAGGEQIPRFTSYFMVTHNQTFLFCVESNSKLALNFSDNNVYLRVYKNLFYTNTAGLTPDDEVLFNGNTNLDNTTRQALIVDHNARLAANRPMLCFVNGYKVPALTAVYMKLGDTAEYIYDGSMREVRRYPINGLSSFESTMDNAYKYLIHDPSLTSIDIDFIDDIDFYVGASFLITEDNGATTRVVDKSYYLGRVKSITQRMVTHRDYSLDTTAVNSIMANLTADLISDHGATIINSLNSSHFFIELNIRNTIPVRQLVYNNNRINELYKLPSDKVLSAMVGPEASVEVWQAANLEASAYMLHMGTVYEGLTPTMLSDAFGYNAISKIVGDTPQYTAVLSGRTTVTLPPQLRSRSTIYEYDEDGYLIDSYHHVVDEVYLGEIANTNITTVIEGLSGFSTLRPDVKYGTDNIVLTEGSNSKVYRCGDIAGNPDYLWEDITDTDAYEIITNNSYVLGQLVTTNTLNYTAVDVPDHHLCVISDKDFLQFSLSLDTSSGSLEFTLAQEEDRGAGYLSYPLTIPYGRIDVFLNKKSLIQDIDFYVDFPVVRIINKKYLIQPAISTPQEILVRFYGFCTPNMELEPLTDKGFVRFGQLSKDTRFNIRDDKVLRITLDGKTLVRDQVSFGEENLAGGISDPLNGLPYQIKDLIVPMKNYVPESTHVLRARAQAIDSVVEDYLSEKIPRVVSTGVMSILAKHSVYSPFFSTIIELMTAGTITENECIYLTTTVDIANRFSSYTVLLNNDPLNAVKDTDFSFVTVFPHTRDTSVSVQANQYRVLSVLVSLYGAGNISISGQIFITP